MTESPGLQAVSRAERGVLRHAPRRYGQSAQGLDLNWYGPGSGPVDILVMASMHGDEVETTVVLSEALRRVPAGALKSPVILGVNPDGILNGTRCNARGVDLNRNWPTRNWRPDTVFHKAHGEMVRDISLSPGAEAGSEPETQALLQLVRRLQPRAIVTLHAPLACIDAPSASPLARWIASQTGLPLVPDVGYETPGSFGTWCAEQDIDVITWETPPESVGSLITSHAPVLFQLLTGAFEPGVV